MDLIKAVQYIQEHGDVVAQARLGFLLYNNRPSPEIVRNFLGSQRPDGGWPPPWAADYSSLDATCYRLAQAEQLGLKAIDIPVERACRFIAGRQREDGSWEEELAEALAAPPWVKPGRRAARLYLTANCGFWMAVLDGNLSGVSMAARYLKERLDARGALPSYLQAHWLAAGIWKKLNFADSLERVLSHLSGRLIELPSANIAWMVVSLHLAEFPDDHSLINQAAIYLEQYQRSDGSWPGEDPEMGDVHSTLEALRALHLYGRL